MWIHSRQIWWQLIALTITTRVTCIHAIYIWCYISSAFEGSRLYKLTVVPEGPDFLLDQLSTCNQFRWGPTNPNFSLLCLLYSNQIIVRNTCNVCKSTSVPKIYFCLKPNYCSEIDFCLNIGKCLKCAKVKEMMLETQQMFRSRLAFGNCDRSPIYSYWIQADHNWRKQSRGSHSGVALRFITLSGCHNAQSFVLLCYLHGLA